MENRGTNNFSLKWIRTTKEKGRLTRTTTLRQTEETGGRVEFSKAIITLYQLQC